MPTNPSDEQGGTTSVFQSDLPTNEKLDRTRTELLDLSARNRLLNMPRLSKGAKAVEIVDEVSAEVFRLLVGEGRPFTFLPGKAAALGEPADGETVPEDQDEIADLAQPDDDAAYERGVSPATPTRAFRPSSPRRDCRSVSSTFTLTRARSRKSRASTSSISPSAR